MAASSTIATVLLLSLLTQIQRIRCPTGFFVDPSDVHAIYGTTAQFRCQYAHHSNESADLRWIYNLESAEATDIVDKVVTVTHGDNEINSTLIVEVRDTGYNRTEVHCLVAITESDSYIITRTDVSELAKLYVTGIPEIEKPSLTAFANGTLHISWDAVSTGNTLAVLRGDQLSYDLVILSSHGEECKRLRNLSHDILSYDLFPSNLTCNKRSFNGCESISVYLTPIINNEFSGTRTKVSTALQPFSLVQNGNAVMITNDTFQFSYRINIIVPLSFCIVEVNLTNVVSRQKYFIDSTTMGPGPTNDLRVTIQEQDVPFDNHYNASVSLSNGSHNVKQAAENNISLSTYAVQNVSQQDNHIVIHFAHGTDAKGAFIVCNNTEGSEFNYSMVNRNSELYTAQLETVSDGNMCSVLVYDVNSTGLLDDKEQLRPSYVVHEQPCIMRGPTNQTQDALSASAGAMVVDDQIVFECNVSNVSKDILGCILIVHDIQDYSTFLVNNILRGATSDSIISNRTVERGKNYSFVIFEWAQSGLLSSQMLNSGMLTVELSSQDMSLTTESDFTDLGNTTNFTSSNSLVRILVPSSMTMITILTAAAVILFVAVLCKQKLLTGKMLSAPHCSGIEHEEQLSKFVAQDKEVTSSESEEELLLKDRAHETEMDISISRERAFYDNPDRPHNEVGVIEKDFEGILLTTNHKDQWKSTDIDDTGLKEKVEKELKELEYPIHSYSTD